MVKPTLNVALIGFGRFGKEYAAELLKISKKRSDINFKFIICKSGRKKANFNGVTIFSYNEIDTAIMNEVNLFIIVTPSHTHQDIIQLLPSNSFKLVEKPLFENELWINTQTDKSRIRCAQIFRHHPLTEFLIDQIDKSEIHTVNSVFYHEKHIDSENTLIELNHLLDLSYYISAITPKKFSYFTNKLGEQIVTERTGDKTITAITMDNCAREMRILEVIMKDGVTFKLDYVNQTYTVSKEGVTEKRYFPKTKSLIEIEILETVNSLFEKSESFSNLQLPEATITKVLESKSFTISNPRIAIIGGGIFGCEAARILSDFGNVTLFEKNSQLLGGATQNNQWRHHKGFHYPISYHTQSEINDSIEIFESYYGDTILNVPSYYCLSATSSEISADRLIASYDLAKLNYRIVEPPNFINANQVSMCLLTDEGIYDLSAMRNFCTRFLNKADINIKYSTQVEQITINDEFDFDVTYSSREQKETSKYNYIVNVAGANWSRFAYMLSGVIHDVDCELTELIQLKSTIPNICATFIDAPFCSITSCGGGGYFQATQRYESLKRKALSETHKFSEDDIETSPNLSILKNINKYVDFPAKTVIGDSVFSTKYILRNRKNIWDRSSEVINYYNGAVSVLGGKILSSTKIGTDIAQIWGFNCHD